MSIDEKIRDFEFLKINNNELIVESSTIICRETIAQSNCLITKLTNNYFLPGGLYTLIIVRTFSKEN